MNGSIAAATAALAIQNGRLARQNERWTYVGIQTFPGCMVLLLVNGADKSTRALVAYDHANPVRISEVA